MRKFALPFILLLLVFSACEKNSTPVVVTYPATICNLEMTTFSVHGFLADNGGKTLKYRGFCLGSIENPTDALPENIEYNLNGFQGGQFSSVIRVLAGSTYHVRAFLKTGNTGDSVYYGNDISFTVSGPYSGQFTDIRDSAEYNWVKIGDQTWMSQNLAYLPAVSGPGSGSDRVPICYVYSYNGKDTAEAKVYTYTDSISGNTINPFKDYGVLYNWAAAKTACPEGWHVPVDSEWQTLVRINGPGAGANLKETGFKHWKDANISAKATNFTSYSAVGGGIRDSLSGFIHSRQNAAFWSATSNGSSEWAWLLYYNSDLCVRNYFDINAGLSVRCIKDWGK